MRNKLFALLKNNADKGAGVRIAAQDGEATIFIYDAIGGFFGIDAETVARDIAAIDAKTIHVRINSPGGDVMDARAIHTALRQHPANVVAHVDGLAASAASFIAMAADRVEIANGAFFMIHNAWTIMLGNAEELRQFAAVLDKIDGTITDDYVAKTGLERAEIEDMMAAETWMPGAEAVEKGFADSLADEEATENRYDLSAYDRVPDALKASPPSPTNSNDNTADYDAARRKARVL